MHAADRVDLAQINTGSYSGGTPEGGKIGSTPPMRARPDSIPYATRGHANRASRNDIPSFRPPIKGIPPTRGVSGRQLCKPECIFVNCVYNRDKYARPLHEASVLMFMHGVAGHGATP